MKSIFTTEDLKNIIEVAFNGSNGQNPNDEQIVTVNEYDGSQGQESLAKSLDIAFYSWKERLAETEAENSVFDSFVQSLNYTLHKTYALVEMTSEEAVMSNDIDSAVDTALVTFLVQTNKIKNFDYYARKVRNYFLGVPQEIENANGDKLTAFLTLGLPQYTDEPTMTQMGECIVCTMQAKVVYLNNADTYADYEFKISFDGENYDNIIMSQMTWQEIFANQSMPRANRPDQVGVIVTGRTPARTMSYYDFNGSNNYAIRHLNELFLELDAVAVIENYGEETAEEIPTTRGSVRVPIWLMVVYKPTKKAYIYRDEIIEMQKVIKNTDYNISSITLRGSAYKGV